MNMCIYYIEHRGVPITPFPIPLTTPPETRMYFVMTVCERGGDKGRASDRGEQR